MSYQLKVYTLSHVLGITGMVVFGTVVIYWKGSTTEVAGMKWFAENWVPYIGAGASILTFLFGLTIVGTPWYDEETNSQLQADHERAEFEWRRKSPEERAILMAAEENRLLQLTQILQNNRILNNQDELKKKRS